MPSRVTRLASLSMATNRGRDTTTTSSSHLWSIGLPSCQRSTSSSYSTHASRRVRFRIFVLVG
jgi:hypothetical protein